MGYEQLDDYSRAFLDKLLIELPEYKEYTRVEKYDDGIDGCYLYVDIPCPSDDESSLWISTYGDEITVGYDYFHIHIGYNDTDEEDYDEAIEKIKEITREEIITITGSADGKWSFSYFIKPNERPSMQIPYDNYDTIYIKSWNGSFNEVITF